MNPKSTSRSASDLSDPSDLNSLSDVNSLSDLNGSKTLSALAVEPGLKSSTGSTETLPSSSVELEAIEPDPIRPEDEGDDASQDDRGRGLIKPRLVKRDMGVRLTEVRRSADRRGGPRAPRGTGALVETEAVSELRRARAIKRAAELINTVSEELELSEALSQQNFELAERARRAAQRLAQADVHSKDGVSDDSESAQEDISAPSHETRRAPQDEPTDSHIQWSLDSDTLDALTVGEADLPALSDLSPDLSAYQSVHDTSIKRSQELSAEQFLQSFDRPATLKSAAQDPRIDNAGRVGRANLDAVQETTTVTTTEVIATHNISGADHLTSSSHHQRALTIPASDAHLDHSPPPHQPIQRGQVIWANTVARDERSLEGRDVSNTQRHGWRLERLQNKVEGAETWIGSPLTEGASVSRDASKSSVVVKLVWPHVLSDNPMMWQFDAEVQIRALQQLDHPTIPKMLAWGEDERSGAWFTITEWVEGVSLSAHLKRGAMSVDDALAVFLPIAEGLTQCHREGVIHRKIQPTHIILSPRGPSLISFQWIGGSSGEDIQRSQQGAYQLFNQRPKFLAPEWMRDALITETVDVYALGACLLDAVTPQGESWRDAPSRIQTALAGALYEVSSERSLMIDLINDLKRSSARYMYQAGNETSPDLPTETLRLDEVIERIRMNELGWHLLARPSNSGALDDPSRLRPWGDFEEVVSALERSQRYQRAPAPLTQETGRLPEHHLKELEHRLEELNAREAELIRFEEDLKWRDEALRAQERALTERDAALQEESTRLDQLREALQVREVGIRERSVALEQDRAQLDGRTREVGEREGELEARSAALRIEAEELDRRAHAQESELELLKVSLESEHARAQAQVRAEGESLHAHLEARAQALLDERRRAVENAERMAEEARTQAEEARHEAQRALEAERAEHQRDLAERERLRVEKSDEDSAFIRAELHRATHMPKSAPDELTHREFEFAGVTLRALYCPPGAGWFGDDDVEAKPEERPRHRAQIAQGFWLTEVPVTQAQWSAVMESNPSTIIGLNHPVEGVGWAEAALFCNALSEAFDLEPAYELEGDPIRSRHRARVHWRHRASGFRLPTEVEWEYAARSGLSGQRHRYALGEDLDAVGWYTQNSSSVTHPVGLKTPNQWGFYDLSGGVWEWCHDEWRRDAYRARVEGPTSNPVAYNPQLTPRVIRGGAWYDFASACRLAARPGQDTTQGYGIGFRVCLPH